jgi:agmatinase
MPADHPNFLGLDLIDPADAAIVIIPVPYDLTSTWHKGADRGPRALLEASAAVELYDIETDSEVHERGIATLPPIECAGPPEEMSALVHAAVGRVLQRGQLPVVLGGEHSVTIGAVKAAATHARDLTVLQIDAHADTREEYEGSTHNHACVMARARERAAIVQVGIRSVDASEMRRLERERVFFAHDIAAAESRDWMDRVVELLTGEVYITIDLDAFDPAYVPATGTPEPGGLDWYTVNELLRRVAAKRRVVGFDVVELLPQEGQHASDFFAAKLVHRLLSEIFAADKRA